METIQVFAINLKKRKDRKEFIKRQFKGRPNFALTITEAVENSNGPAGLWQSIRNILREQISQATPYIIICEDDHRFLDNYSEQLLNDCIANAQSGNADVLLGGVSWFSSVVPVAPNLYWVEHFTGTQFMVIFRKFFNTLMSSEFGPTDSADYKISTLSNRIFMIFPFISVQKDFGYSDVTVRNNKAGIVDSMFTHSIDRLELVEKVIAHYQKLLRGQEFSETGNFDGMAVPMYILNLPCHGKNRTDIETTFLTRNEFELSIIELTPEPDSQQYLWDALREIITSAMANEDDLIILCAGDFEFAVDYSPQTFFGNVIDAYHLGCDFLVGSAFYFDLALPITRNLFWTNHCTSGQYIVLYRSLFQPILNHQFDASRIVANCLSELTGSKMLLHPSLSQGLGSTFLNIPSSHGSDSSSNILMAGGNKRLENIKEAYLHKFPAK